MKQLAIVLAVAMVSMAMPASASNSDINRAWVLENVTGDLNAVYSGTTGLKTGWQIVDEVVARMGDVNVPATIAANVVTPGGDVGDVWMIGFGGGSCGPNQILAPSPAFIPVDGQLWIYSGGVGTGSASGFSGFTIGWTSKTSGSFSGTVNYGVVSDFFCFDGFIFFPYIDGLWWQ